MPGKVLWLVEDALWFWGGAGECLWKGYWDFNWVPARVWGGVKRPEVPPYVGREEWVSDIRDVPQAIVRACTGMRAVNQVPGVREVLQVVGKHVVVVCLGVCACEVAGCREVSVCRVCVFVEVCGLGVVGGAVVF